MSQDCDGVSGTRSRPISDLHASLPVEKLVLGSLDCDFGMEVNTSCVRN